MQAFGEVAEIWRYPVSSLGGERLEAAAAGPGGLAGDRVWGLFERASGAVAAPEQRKVWRGVPEIVARTGARAPEVRVPGGSWLAAEDAAEAASAVLGVDVAFAPHDPFGSGGRAPRYARGDLHLVTTASLRALAALLPDPAEAHPRRFRPNLLIATPPEVEGFAEQALIGRRMQVGEVTLRLAEPCARCAFTALAQGELRFEPAVLHAISQHGAGAFGVLAAVEAGGTVRAGDRAVLLPG